MSQHIRGISREQVALPPTAVEDYVGADSLPRVIDEFVKGLDLQGLRYDLQKTPMNRISLTEANRATVFFYTVFTGVPK